MAADPLPSPAPDLPLRPGTVVARRGADLEVELQGRVERARLATAPPPGPGDEVLVASDGAGTLYVLGVLRQLREVDVCAETRDGTRVRKVDDEEGEALRIEAADGTLLFEYREGRSRISAPSGTLELHAEAGDLALRAAKRVRVEGEEGVLLRSPGRVSVETGGSTLGMDPEGTTLDAPRVRIGASDVEADIARTARLRADRTELLADVVATTARRLTTDADQVVERLRERYLDIAELAQTRAGNVRMIARQTFRVLGERTLLKAKRDMKLKAKTIYLD